MRTDTGAKKGLDIITGIRPTGQLTIANYLGAVKPIVELQDRHLEMMVFVADLHGLTTHEPEVLRVNVRNVILDYIALGLDPNKTGIFIQSAIGRQLSLLTLLLARHITIAELMRVPTLKDKIRHGQSEETATALLAMYPVLMAADIILPRALSVPVGKDQVAHIEVTRELARRFNKNYGPIFPIPRVQNTRDVNILSLKGDTKMSKSYPEEALFLMDDEDVIRAKIKRAETAEAGDITPNLINLFEIAKGLAKDVEQRKYFKTLLKNHEGGQAVMGEFKQALAQVAVDFIKHFQEKRTALEYRKDYLDQVIQTGNTRVTALAEETMAMIKHVIP